MALVYTLANQKGGVGKTTTAVNLGAYLAASGRRALLIDLDPQANATSSLGVDKNAVRSSIYDVLVRDVPIGEALMLTKRVGLDLVPSTPALAGAEVEMVSFLSRENRLRRAIHPLLTKYHYILIDPPPSLGILTVNSLTAAQGVIVPIQCEYLALEGLTQLLQTITLIRESVNASLSIRGILLTMYDARTRLSQQVADEVRQHFGPRVFKALIPRSVRISESPSYGEPVLAYAPSSAGALAYEAFAQELLRGDLSQKPS
jgi:chromosome partitioning protein